jgi:hypothetical protein
MNALSTWALRALGFGWKTLTLYCGAVTLLLVVSGQPSWINFLLATAVLALPLLAARWLSRDR